MKVITYSKNVFIPLTTICANDCSYCHFKEPISQAKIMSLSQIKTTIRQAKKAGCKEVLFTSGSCPEDVSGFEKKLKRETGFESWFEFLIAVCREALKQGLLPHTNVGVLSKEKLKKLARYNASLGLMLETTADVEAHKLSPTKSFAVRREMIAAAGQLKIPFTSGLLLGIGENRKDRIESLEELKKLDEQYGHLQEIILQPVDPPQRSGLSAPGLEAVLDTLELAKDILPKHIALQVPPNLVEMKALIATPINDLGGISTLTPDYINPDHQWPKIKRIKKQFSEIKFQERLPVYEQYLNQDWIREPVWKCLQNEGMLNEFKTEKNSK
ncbi:MAG: 7,8-didemethyl-8-hydroxy-5-deazariboflavin synthase subunit CofG [Halanaerobium sp.]